MATNTVAYVQVPVVDSTGNFINYNPLGAALAPLTSDGLYHIMQSNAFDATNTYQGQAVILLVFLIATNDAAALAAFDAFKATLAPGTVCNVWYTNQTVGG
jgi:hypothetical protein